MIEEWNNESVPLLFDAPGTTKFVHWSTNHRKAKEVNSLRDVKQISKKSYHFVRKPHLSREYRVKDGNPVIPKPALPPGINRLQTHPILIHNERRCDRYGKPPVAPKRPVSPIIIKKKYDTIFDQHSLKESVGDNEWIMYIDPSSGWPYYYNQIENYSTYDKPKNFRDELVEENQDHNRLMSDSDKDDGFRSGWVECWDEEVEAYYYYNQITGEASWVIPSTSVQELNTPY